MQIDYKKESRTARALAGSLSLVAMVLAFLFFFALTDSLLRAAIALVSGGLLFAVSAWIGDLNRAAIVYDAQGRGENEVVKNE